MDGNTQKEYAQRLGRTGLVPTVMQLDDNYVGKRAVEVECSWEAVLIRLTSLGINLREEAVREPTVVRKLELL